MNQTEVMLVQHCDVVNAADYSLLNGSFYVNVNFTTIFKNKTNEQNPKNSLSVLGPGPPCPTTLPGPSGTTVGAKQTECFTSFAECTGLDSLKANIPGGD